MKRTYRFVLLTLLLLTAAAFCAAAAVEQPISTADEAVTRWLTLSDLGSCPGIADGPASVDMTTYRDSTTPFLAEQLDGSRAWRVEYHRMKFGTARTEQARQFDRERTVVVYIDSATAKLLRATFTLDDKKDSLWPEPEAEESSQQLAGLREVYYGLPAEDPKVTLRDAIGRCDFVPESSFENIVWYVEYSQSIGERTAKSRRPAWVIYMRGSQSLLVGPDTTSMAAKHQRRVIDAMNPGEEDLIYVNFPLPPEPKKK